MCVWRLESGGGGGMDALVWPYVSRDDGLESVEEEDGGPDTLPELTPDPTVAVTALPPLPGAPLSSPPEALNAIRLASAELVFRSVGNAPKAAIAAKGLVFASAPTPAPPLALLGPNAWSSPFNTAAARPRSMDKCDTSLCRSSRVCCKTSVLGRPPEDAVAEVVGGGGGDDCRGGCCCCEYEE